jgi:6-pyruvoyltetrahydropterin/6-carboxytetrahydropterin synthase
MAPFVGSNTVVTVVKRIEFSASHFFWVPEWDAIQNQAAFGPVSNRFGHGHNYVLKVAVAGITDLETGMVINLTALKILLQQAILTPLHFRHLNLQVPFFWHNQPTLEALVVYVWHRLQTPVETLGFTLKRIELNEADDMGVVYTGTPVAGIHQLETIGLPSVEDSGEHPLTMPLALLERYPWLVQATTTTTR